MITSATRRSILVLLGMAPTGAPLLKQALDAETMKLAGVGSGGASHGQPAADQSTGNPPLTEEQRRLALRIPAARTEIETLLYEEQRNVGYLDADLACLHSMSLNARLCFQRQRNVKRRIAEMENGWQWQRLDRAFLRFLRII